MITNDFLQNLEKYQGKIGKEHLKSFKKYGFCTLEGCRCNQRPTFSRHKIGKIVLSTPELTAKEIKEIKAKWKRLEKIRKSKNG
jgi:hypothetical protein